MTDPTGELVTHAQVRGVDVLLTIDDIAAIYRLSPATIRSYLQKGTFRPQPARKYPYRWRKADIERDLQVVRDERYAKHGFASKKFRPAKAQSRAKRSAAGR